MAKKMNKRTAAKAAAKSGRAKAKPVASRRIARPAGRKTGVVAVKAIPDGYHSVTPFLSTKGASQLVNFLKQAFGAKEIMSMPGPGGVVMHAEVNIGNSRLMVSEAMQGEPNRGTFYLYVEDADALYNRALTAGATSEREPKDEFWGDRTAMVKDPFGNTWSVATHEEDVSPDEMGRRAAAAMS
jgi:PhnB protein